MEHIPSRQDQSLVSKEGIIAGALCAIIPLIVTGILRFQYLTQRGSFGDFFMTTMAFVFAITQFMMK